MSEDSHVVRGAWDRTREFGERTGELGRISVLERLRRLRGRWFFIAQCAVTAALAWLAAQLLLGHPTPFFAPIAAVLVLGLGYGQRARRSLEVAVGVAVGVGVGDLFVLLFGSGVWQILVVVAVAMSLATLVGAGRLMVTQAAVQSIVVTTLLPDPGQGVARWLDAAVGCGVALLVATIAPSAPLRRPRQLAAALLRDLAGTLEGVADAVRAGDGSRADTLLQRARDAEACLDDLRTASDEALAAARLSPFLRRHLADVDSYAALVVPLDHAVRNLRVLARRAAASVWQEENVPEDYLALLESLADVAAFMAEELSNRRLPTRARDRLLRLGHDRADRALVDSLSAVVILGQARSIIADLLELTGLPYVEARQHTPGPE